MVLRFYKENNFKSRKINNFIYFVCYNINKCVMKCRFEEKHIYIVYFKLKHSIFTQNDVLIYVKAHKYSKLFFDVGNIL